MLLSFVVTLIVGSFLLSVLLSSLSTLGGLTAKFFSLLTPLSQAASSESREEKPVVDEELIELVKNAVNKTLLSTYTAIYTLCIRVSTSSEPICAEVHVIKQRLSKVLIQAALTFSALEQKVDFLLYRYVHNLSKTGLLRCVELNLNAPVGSSLLSNGQCSAVYSIKTERDVLRGFWLVAKPLLQGLRQVEVSKTDKGTLVCFSAYSTGRFLAADIVVKADKVCIEDRGSYAILKYAYAEVRIGTGAAKQTYVVEISLVNVNPVFTPREWLLALTEMTRKYEIEENSFTGLLPLPLASTW